MYILPYYQKQIDYNKELLTRSNERQSIFINDIIKNYYEENNLLISVINVSTKINTQSFNKKLPINSEITVLKIKDDSCIFTVNKGKKEYVLPIYRIIPLIKNDD